MAKENDHDFIAALDEAAKVLLSKAGVSAKVEGGAPAPVCTLAEQVKAFEAVVDWAKTRRDLKPPEKAKSAFDDIRNQFAGTAPVSGRNSRRSRKAAASGDADAPAEPGAGDDDLFGADKA